MYSLSDKNYFVRFQCEFLTQNLRRLLWKCYVVSYVGVMYFNFSLTNQISHSCAPEVSIIEITVAEFLETTFSD